MTTVSEKQYMAIVALVPCVLCTMLSLGKNKSEIHHLRTGQGMSERASNFLIIALCPECHRGPNGLHGTRALLRIAKVDELDLLAATIEAVIKITTGKP